MNLRQHNHAPAKARQKGIAAIEFAIVFIALFFILYALSTFAAVLYVQQTVSRAAEDGARAAPLLPGAPVANDAIIAGVVYDSLADSLVVPVANNGSTSSRRAWLAQNVVVGVAVVNPGPVVTVTVSYPYSANRLLPSLPAFDSSRWMPDDLRSRATIALQS